MSKERLHIRDIYKTFGLISKQISTCLEWSEEVKNPNFPYCMKVSKICGHTCFFPLERPKKKTDILCHSCSLRHTREDWVFNLPAYAIAKLYLACSPGSSSPLTKNKLLKKYGVCRGCGCITTMMYKLSNCMHPWCMECMKKEKVVGISSENTYKCKHCSKVSDSYVYDSFTSNITSVIIRIYNDYMKGVEVQESNEVGDLDSLSDFNALTNTQPVQRKRKRRV